jgi:2-C-methyl-D-erythritol 4-phosphate cytidylyltransferase
MQNIAVVLAAGNSTRFNSKCKLIHRLNNNLSVIQNTVSTFLHSNAIDIIIIVSSSKDIKQDISILHQAKPLFFTEGGQTRFASLLNAISYIKDHLKMDESLINLFIHDGARPLLTDALVQKLNQSLSIHNAVVPVTSISETVKSVNANKSSIVTSVNRESLKLAQTPQCFYMPYLEECLSLANIKQDDTRITDDASIAELAGKLVHYIEGEKSNIKITTTEDVLFANFYLNS